ncbi:MAG: hypothetical protein ACXVCE_16985, partial [Bacteriovorax sp.]
IPKSIILLYVNPLGTSQIQVNWFFNSFYKNSTTHAGPPGVTEFYNRISVTSDSSIEIEKAHLKLPLTCIWIHGVDNRKFQSIPESLRKIIFTEIYFVSGDAKCKGPVNVNYPYEGDSKKNWDNFIKIENWTLDNLKFGSAVISLYGVEHGISEIKTQTSGFVIPEDWGEF